jgi:hypothetical protein
VVLGIAIIVKLLAAAVVIFAATRPNALHLRRSTTIKAAPEKSLALINDLHKWNDCSAEDVDDRKIRRTRARAAAGARRNAIPSNAASRTFISSRLVGSKSR